jgi:hypothetical protein
MNFTGLIHESGVTLDSRNASDTRRTRASRNTGNAVNGSDFRNTSSCDKSGYGRGFNFWSAALKVFGSIMHAKSTALLLTMRAKALVAEITYRLFTLSASHLSGFMFTEVGQLEAQV